MYETKGVGTGKAGVLTSISSFDGVVVELRLLRQQKDPGPDKGVELRLR